MSLNDDERSQRIGDFLQEVALARGRVREERPALRPNGFCHNCQEGIGLGRSFCDSDCRDDWEKRNP